MSIFLLLLAGYIARKTKALKSEDAGIVNSIIINLTMPAFIFVNTNGKMLTPGMIKAPALGFLLEMVILALAYLASRALKLDRKTTGAVMIVSAFGNTGFLGYPVVKAAFPGNDEAILTAVLFDNFGMAMILSSIGIAVASAFAGTKFEWKNMLLFLKSPLLPATIIALIFKNVHVPALIMDTLQILGRATVPLAMISIGLSLSTGSLKEYSLPILTATILKMGLLPLLMYFTLPYLGVQGTIYKVAVLESAMPSAVFSGVVTSRYGCNGKYAAAAIFVMTLLSIGVIPGILVSLSR